LSGALKKIDPESQEFKDELEKTIKFTEKVINQFGYAYNPDDEINDSVRFGLTRNKLIYGKRFCPCFFVTNTKEDRICPCKPAINEEIPSEGKCHCGIFCTPEYAASQRKIEDIEAAVHEHSRGLTKEECEVLIAKDDLDSDEMISLLEARELGMVDFLVVDVREWMENKTARIKGTDKLVPTTSFYQSLEELENAKETNIILYCHVGSRSAYCQRIMRDLGYKKVRNLAFGIAGFHGEIERG